ncbi:helix-turn-helix domain-containing protein [Lactiplantibacillus plantarum]|uniref:helix-turn-helix domain-containing protein n=1 Tax=Lactiplantibacillus plantarum TaxID=1590 RepID=UPI002E8E0779|nr:helix-turn-helix domain-containing protein [Lactiplantibacillus plantarum]
MQLRDQHYSRRQPIMSSYHQLTISERELIFLYHELSFSIRRIAQLIKRAPSTISRELR